MRIAENWAKHCRSRKSSCRAGWITTKRLCKYTFRRSPRGEHNALGMH